MAKPLATVTLTNGELLGILRPRLCNQARNLALFDAWEVCITKQQGSIRVDVFRGIALPDEGAKS